MEKKYGNKKLNSFFFKYLEYLKLSLHITFKYTALINFQLRKCNNKQTLIFYIYIVMSTFKFLVSYAELGFEVY